MKASLQKVDIEIMREITERERERERERMGERERERERERDEEGEKLRKNVWGGGGISLILLFKGCRENCNLRRASPEQLLKM